MIWLQEYERQLGKLNVDTSSGVEAPHKRCLLLAVLDLFESGYIRSNRILFDDALRSRFSEHFNHYRSASNRDNPHLPFFHLRSEPFWHHRIHAGREVEYAALKTASGPGVIRRTIAYAFLDEPLFELLMRGRTRNRLRDVLISDLITISGREIDADGNGWGWLECECTVSAYLDMLEQELRGERYSKAAARRGLHPHLPLRSEGAIEYKLQNISAVMIEMGYPYIAGYKPAFRYQHQLRDVLEVHLAHRYGAIEQMADESIDRTEPGAPVIDWNAVEQEPPERAHDEVREPVRSYTPRKYNYAASELRNRKLGELGERFVLAFEKQRMERAGRSDLIDEIQWTSRELGDGAGYDIRSFIPEQDREFLIEVKTTNGGKYQPFMITENEVAFSRERQESYALYRVFEYRRDPKLYIIDGDVSEHVSLAPSLYRASV